MPTATAGGTPEFWSAVKAISAPLTLAVTRPSAVLYSSPSWKDWAASYRPVDNETKSNAALTASGAPMPTSPATSEMTLTPFHAIEPR